MLTFQGPILYDIVAIGDDNELVYGSYTCLLNIVYINSRWDDIMTVELTGKFKYIPLPELLSM